jgi:hypothetical protein
LKERLTTWIPDAVKAEAMVSPSYAVIPFPLKVNLTDLARSIASPERGERRGVVVVGVVSFIK